MIGCLNCHENIGCVRGVCKKCDSRLRAEKKKDTGAEARWLAEGRLLPKLSREERTRRWDSVEVRGETRPRSQRGEGDV